MNDTMLITPVAHRDELMKERDELLKALRIMREQADKYWMEEQIKIVDPILAKYPPE